MDLQTDGVSYFIMLGAARKHDALGLENEADNLLYTRLANLEVSYQVLKAAVIVHLEDKPDTPQYQHLRNALHWAEEELSCN
jgi:hypothetical protein